MKCRLCNTTANLIISSTKNYKKINGEISKSITYVCRDCNTARLKKYRATENGRASVKKAVQKYESLNPERKKAWTSVQRFDTKPCVMCGQLPTHKHHPDISQPQYVVALCPKHHKAAHKQTLTMV